MSIKPFLDLFFAAKKKQSNGADETYKGKHPRKGRIKVEIESFSKPKNGDWTFVGYRVTPTEFTRFTLQRPNGTNVKQAKSYVKNGYRETKRRRKDEL